MLKINMLSAADKVAGQGVGSAYLELIRLLKTRNKKTLDISINKLTKADITHYHTINFPYFLMSFLKKKAGRQIGYVHFLPETLDGSIKLPPFAFAIFKRYVMAFYRRMDHLVVVNPDFKLKLMALGIPEDEITFIPNFVAKAQFYEEDEATKAATRAKYNLKSDDFIVLGAGQIQERKGFDDFVELAKENPLMQFIWAGGFSFGKLTDGYERYKKIVENPPKNVFFPGIVDREEMRGLQNIADVFLLPSYSELFPMTVLETASCGTPIMLRDLELYHGILQGQYIACADKAQMNEKLNALLKNPEEKLVYKQKANEIAKKYSEEKLSQIWETFYQEQAKMKKI
ncbi:MAG: glycosyltransferase family 4 protein [Streptococcaceae bacterium]|nr:glycosyltransferase family 4 protein [Streptococcaceae bacterium]